MILCLPDVQDLIELAIREDLSLGDITSECTILSDARASARIIARQNCVLAGQDIAREVFRRIDAALDYRIEKSDGAITDEGEIVSSLCGAARSILAGERTALNFLQRLSGIATFTHAMTAHLHDTECTLLDTRKTTPGWRILEKYAVRLGGAANHRMNLGDGILIKDNHIVAAGGIPAAMAAARSKSRHLQKIQVEVRSRSEAREAVASGADGLLLDNMSPADVAQIVQEFGKRVFLEASGGIQPETLRKFALTGVHYISMGALTHSAPAADIALDLQ